MNNFIAISRRQHFGPEHIRSVGSIWLNLFVFYLDDNFRMAGDLWKFRQIKISLVHLASWEIDR